MAKRDKRHDNPGRPQYEFTEEQIAIAEEMATDWCQDGTIATVLGVDIGTVKHYLSKRLQLKRAEAKHALRKLQRKQADKNPIVGIFLGKNYLGQADKQEIRHGLDEQTSSLLVMIDGKDKGVLPGKG